MHETIRSILRFYVCSAIWLAVTLGIGFASLGPVDLVLFDASPVVRGMAAMALGIAAGSLVAWLAWISLSVRAATAATTTADSPDLARGTASASTGSGVRS
jgi:hypothetical protein